MLTSLALFCHPLEKCEDKSSQCGANPGIPPQACDKNFFGGMLYNQAMTQCPKMCKVCGKHLRIVFNKRTCVNLAKQGHHRNGDLDDHTYCAGFALGRLELWRKLYDYSLHHYKTSQCIVKSVRLIFSTTSNGLAEAWRGDFSTPGFGGGGLWGRGWAHSIVRPWVPISSPYMVYLLSSSRYGDVC